MVDRESLSSRFYNYAICAVRLSDFPSSPSLNSFSAFLIIDSTWLLEEKPLTCCSFVGLAFRVAQMLGEHSSSITIHVHITNNRDTGLDREPSRFPEISPADVQTRRQLFWTLVALDAQVAFASGLPPIINHRLYKVKYVTETSETGFSPNPSFTQSSASKSILGVFVGGKYRFYGVAGEFLHLLNQCSLKKVDVDSILKMTKRIREELASREAQITTIEQRIVSQDADNGSNSQEYRHIESNMSLGAFTRMVLSMLAAKPYAVMYGPLRRHGLLPYLRQKEPE